HASRAFGVTAVGSTAVGFGTIILDADGDGLLDIFCANAGIEAGGGSIEDSWARTWEVNVMAHVRAFEALAPQWLERGSGRFISTVSAAGLLTMPGAAAYSATKHAALAYAEWLSMTYGDRGITVQAVCPLGVRTDLVDLSRPQTAIVLGPTLIGAEAVAQTVVEALDDDRFLILPHTEVAGFYAGRATDTDRWLAGMRRIQSAIDAAEAGGR
ncbi:MAG: SDR family NAD(P)-dependent oxidoreductase, partial [Candidatus Nanopelagicales bacterium]